MPEHAVVNVSGGRQRQSKALAKGLNEFRPHSVTSRLMPAEYAFITFSGIA